MYCYPHDGFYSGDEEVQVDFGTSPACDLVNRIFSVFDVAATVVTVGATAVGIAALCTIPIAGPIAATAAVAGASSGVYAAGRSGYTLYDRGTHDQSIALTDKEALACWLSVVGSSLGFAQGQMLSSMTTAARAGEVMGKAGRIAFVVVNVGCLTVNGIGIVHGLAVLVDKHERDQLTPLDVFQFSASVLFFTNSWINFKTAGTIIKEVQHDTINQHREGLTPDAKKLFNKHTGKLRGPDEMHGNARVIKTLNRIDNKQQLYEMMVNKDIDNRRVKLYPDGYKGLLNVNKEFKVHPIKFMEMHPDVRQQIMSATKQLANQQVSVQDFKKQMASICKENRIRFECMRKETVDNLCRAYGANSLEDIVVNKKRLFSDMKPHEIDRVSVVLANAGKNYDSKLLEVATKFAESRNCKNVGDFCSYMEFCSLHIAEMKRTLEMDYQQKLSEARGLRNFNQAQFDRNYGIEGKRTACFEQQVLRNFEGQHSQGLREMNANFDKWKTQVGEANRQAKTGFFSDNAATYHYIKHRDFPQSSNNPSGQVSVDQYFKIASDLLGNPANQTNAMLSQEGNCTFITFKSPVNGAFGVRIDRIQDGNCVSGIATVMYARDG
ncbi:unnamed protein product [Allacma fusca]|uniref:DUF4781 domain-containing protein n=1 Tax=Allacma fusca TaxID=39272 RepID=A0A8J2Q4L4_9HEXA|nr:unnamed protein product [Allacma fusca]